MRTVLTILAIIAAATSLDAQQIVLGAGYADFSHDRSDDQPALSLEYHLQPFYEATRLHAGFAGALSAHTNGDVHLGIGLAATYWLAPRWFVEASVMPGAYFESEPANTLGSRFQIRSLLGLGYGFENGNRLSLAITHKSNASTTDFNPGLNTALIRFHRPF